MGIEVSLVVPAYNEADRIAETVDRALDALGAFLPDGTFEVVVAEDGCDDRTPEVAADLAASDPRVRHLHSDERLGRGDALQAAFREARGDTVAYMDADLATSLDHLEELVEAVRTRGYDVATGSRWMPGREAPRPLPRRLLSRGYNALVRVLLRSRVRDHQCGFKAFDRDALMEILTDVDHDHWFWDTEVLVRAQEDGYEIHEFPVDWDRREGSTVNLSRDTLEMGTSLAATAWSSRTDPATRDRLRVAAGVLLVALAAGLAFVYLDVSLVTREIRRTHPGWILGAIGVYLASWPVRGVRYQRVLDGMGFPLEMGFLTQAIFLSQSGNLVFPARSGDGIRAYLVQAYEGVPYGTGFASLAVERVLDVLAVTVAAGIGILAFSRYGDVGILASSGLGTESTRLGLRVAGVVGVLAVAAVAGLVALSRSGRRPLGSAADRLPEVGPLAPLRGGLRRFETHLGSVAGDGPGMARLFAWSLLIWVIDVATVIVVLQALDVPLGGVAGVAAATLAVSLGNLAKVLPLSPGGIGLYEGVFTGVYAALTAATWPVALAVALVDHALKNLVTVAGGGLAVASLNVDLGDAARRSRRSDEPR